MNTVEWDWNELYYEDYPYRKVDSKRNVGFIVSDIQKICPELVIEKEGKHGGLL